MTQTDYSLSSSFNGVIAFSLTPEGEKAPWMLELEAQNPDHGQTITYTGIEERSKSWDQSYSHLTKEAAAVVSVAAAVATSWAGGFGGALSGGLSVSSIGTVALQAGITSLASHGAVSSNTHN